MTAARAAERTAHDALRETIRQASLAHWDRRISEAEPGEAGSRPGCSSTTPVVAVFDAGHDHNVIAVLRTDGSCAQYRTVGLLTQALVDTV